MSCDRNRALFFQQVEPQIWTAFGPRGAAQALETIFEVAKRQPLPSDAARLAAEAATRKAMIRAKQFGIDLYPHKSKDGVPKPDIQAGWKAVMDVIDAVEARAPLPPLAADVQQSLGFQQVMGRAGGGGGWDAPTSAATRLFLRRAWASQPALVRALVGGDAATLGDAAYAPLYRELCAQIAVDPQVPSQIAGAARHYLTLDDEEMIGPEERRAWAVYLGGMAGVGARTSGQHPACGKCGEAQAGSWHRCRPVRVATYPEMAQAVLAVLADPEYADVATLASPRAQMERLLERATREGPPKDFSGPLAALWAVAQDEDRRTVQWLAEATLTDHRLYQSRAVTLATVRTPLMFGDRRLVWDGGRLYDADWYRQNAEWRTFAAPEPMAMTRSDLEGVVAFMEERQVLDLMAGRPVAPTAMEWRSNELFHRYPSTAMNALQLQAGDVFRRPCGCIFRLDRPDSASQARSGYVDVVRLYEGDNCYEHRGGWPRTMLLTDEPVKRVALDTPRFRLPSWDGRDAVVRPLTPEDTVAYRSPIGDRRVVRRG